jgi:cell wall assembly regulator SMI1
MWIEFLRGLTSECEFEAPATEQQLSTAETALGIKLPPDLRDLLRESDGVMGEYGLGLVWSLGQIVEENLRFRASPSFRDLYMPFDHLLFFADAGNGDQFAFPIHADGVIHRADVFAWNHEEDSRTWVAQSLRDYLEGWISGRITL